MHFLRFEPCFPSFCVENLLQAKTSIFLKFSVCSVQFFNDSSVLCFPHPFFFQIFVLNQPLFHFHEILWFSSKEIDFPRNRSLISRSTFTPKNPKIWFSSKEFFARNRLSPIFHFYRVWPLVWFSDKTHPKPSRHIELWAENAQRNKVDRICML